MTNEPDDDVPKDKAEELASKAAEKYKLSSDEAANLLGVIRSILALFDSWVAHADSSWPWRPFGGDWKIDADKFEPHEQLAKARKDTLGDRRSASPLSEACLGTLRKLLNGNAPEIVGRQRLHCYTYARNKPQIWARWEQLRPAGESPYSWSCTGVTDAGDKYSWSESGCGAFHSLALALQHAVGQNDCLKAAAICLVILKWGGVYPRAKFFKLWIMVRAWRGTLCSDLLDATERLIPQSKKPLNDFNGVDRFMDSSSVKVYAALALDLSNGFAAAGQDVLVYDGRVAAAIGLITRIVLEHHCVVGVPKHLRFPVDRTKDDDGVVRRDPGNATYNFSRMTQGRRGHKQRANYSRIASRYIQDIIGVVGPSAAFAQTEKGLFMIGYDVRGPEDMASDVRAIIDNQIQARNGAALIDFIRRAVELNKFGRTQVQAIKQAAEELNFPLTRSHTEYPGSYFCSWRKQGYV